MSDLIILLYVYNIGIKRKMMNNKITINIAFIILLILLAVSSIKSIIATEVPKQNTFSGFKNFDIEKFKVKDIEIGKGKSQATENTIILRDFDEIPQSRQSSQAIDKGTASLYVKTRPLSGTEILELGKIYKIGKYLNDNKKIVIYVNRGNDRDVQAFISEFAKVRSGFSGNPNYVFYPLETMWDLDDLSAQNSHDRVINNFKKDCGLVCIIDTGASNITRMKGYAVNKKSAQIMGVMLK